MKIEKFIENTATALQNANIAPDNLITAIIKLLEIAHANGLDNAAKAALADCGITLDISEE